MIVVASMIVDIVVVIMVEGVILRSGSRDGA
jgi:hypothetical protein